MFSGSRLWLGPGFSSSLLDSYSEESLSCSWFWSWADDGSGAVGAAGEAAFFAGAEAWAWLRLMALQEVWRSVLVFLMEAKWLQSGVSSSHQESALGLSMGTRRGTGTAGSR